jgi:histidine triad (HIT) family protein
MSEDPCPFCEIVAGRAPAKIIDEWSDAFVIEPLNPVVRGHVLVIPKTHVADFTTDPAVSAAVMFRAAQFATGMGPYNLITSKGRPATQSVFHLHLHLIPRAVDDGLALPWYSGKSKKSRMIQAKTEVADS